MADDFSLLEEQVLEVVADKWETPIDIKLHVVGRYTRGIIKTHMPISMVLDILKRYASAGVLQREQSIEGHWWEDKYRKSNGTCP